MLSRRSSRPDTQLDAHGVRCRCAWLEAAGQAECLLPDLSAVGAALSQLSTQEFFKSWALELSERLGRSAAPSPPTLCEVAQAQVQMAPSAVSAQPHVSCKLSTRAGTTWSPLIHRKLSVHSFCELSCCHTLSRLQLACGAWAQPLQARASHALSGSPAVKRHASSSALPCTAEAEQQQGP